MAYICIEGTEGVGKTTQTQRLSDWLRSQGLYVIQTKEPGTPLSPLTMKLRELMLDNKYASEMTLLAREFISQAIRSVHLQHVVSPAPRDAFIVQDRGLMSGFAYGTACGNDPVFLQSLSNRIVMENSPVVSPYRLYDLVIYLKGDPELGLQRAKTCKQEFAAGDAMEAKGAGFMQSVSSYMDSLAPEFGAKVINVDNKSVEQVFEEVLAHVSPYLI